MLCFHVTTWGKGVWYYQTRPKHDMSRLQNTVYTQNKVKFSMHSHWHSWYWRESLICWSVKCFWENATWRIWNKSIQGVISPNLPRDYDVNILLCYKGTHFHWTQTVAAWKMKTNNIFYFTMTSANKRSYPVIFFCTSNKIQVWMKQMLKSDPRPTAWDWWSIVNVFRFFLCVHVFASLLLHKKHFSFSSSKHSWGL